ncbi:hypothetical protein CRUP_004570 [Coryphaenoides rupestris]|nr:hypothetical protein CRUP_004570 [Coryphaenoides rupestris]
MEHNSPVLREGFLVKQVHLVRVCLIFHTTSLSSFSDRLLYYKYAGSKRDSCQRGRVMLEGLRGHLPLPGLVFKLRTQSSVEHFLEACSREERDAWAAAISSAVEVLRQGGGGASDAQQDDSSSSSSSSRWQQQHLQDVKPQVVDQMYDVHSGIKMTHHVEQGSTFSNCFSGSAVVDWLVFSGSVLSRVEAVTLASALMEEGFLRPLGQRSVEALRTAGLSQQFLDDSTALYCFVSHRQGPPPPPPLLLHLFNSSSSSLSSSSSPPADLLLHLSSSPTPPPLLLLPPHLRLLLLNSSPPPHLILPLLLLLLPPPPPHLLLLCAPPLQAESFKKRGSVKVETSLAAVELSGHVTRRGYLLKQGHQRKNWKVRLFVLRSEPSYLHYYDPSKNDIIPAGGFPLKGCLVSALQDNGVPSGVKGEVQGNLFKVITKSDTHYYIQAPTNADKMGWIEAIRREI